MSTDAAALFDLGPLSWVQGEIDQALSRGLESLAAFAADPANPSVLQHARNHVHQAAGAIQMVGLDAVAAYADEIERQLARIETLDAAAVRDAAALIERACRKLQIFLTELVNDHAPVPLKLFPEFEAMQQARGVKAVAPADLFYPDLNAKSPPAAPGDALPPAKLASYLVKQRRSYQRGLLEWLRGEAKGGKSMREAIAGIEKATPQPNLRAFWWTVGAVLDGIAGRGLDSSFGTKQLAARIDLQIRRVAEGSAKVADRLRREVLYFAAICAPVTPQVRAVQQAYRLAGLIPSAEVLSSDVVHIQPHLREAREQLAGAKEAWLKAASGRAENLPKLKQTLASVHTKAAEIKNGALMKLTAALVERLDKMPTSGVSETLAMEFATALLLAESAFENYSNLSPEFPKQVDAMLVRLDAARAGRPTSAHAPLLDEMSKRAQERVLLAQVGREIQANLRHMEQVLDAFFRDNTKRAELASLTKDSTQIRGALQMLGLDDAERLLALCQEQIESYAGSEEPVANDDLELLAESLSGLGFYIEAVEQQRPDRDRLIAPLIRRRTGEAAPDPTPQADSVEQAVAELRAQLPQLVAEAQRAPTDAAAQEALKKKLAGLRDDAELIGDGDLAAQADGALKQLAAEGAAALQATVEAMAETGAPPAPEVSAETQRLLDTDHNELDRELLDIYLVEAAEVLDAVSEGRRTLDANHGDREALATVRRQFHTLKGSGRMVGLTELGELAWKVEHLHNRLIEEGRPVTKAVVAMIGVAEACFRRWVGLLRDTGHVAPDEHELLVALHAVERELPGGEHATPPAPPAAAAPATPAPAVPAPRAPASSPVADADVAPLAAPTLDFPALELMSAAPDAETPRVEHAPPLHAVPHEPASADAPVEPASVDAADFAFAELGAGGDAPTIVVADAAPEDEAIEFVLPEIDVAPPALKLVADNPEPRAAAHDGERKPVLAVAPSDDVVIGAVRLSSSLWNILCEEAAQHIATLTHELSLLQFDPALVPSEPMVRASHTLCGIHRTAGLPLVAETAHELEKTLIALSEHGVPLPEGTQPVLAHAVAVLAELVDAVRRRAAFTAHDEATIARLVDDMAALREAAVGPVAGDAETAAAAVALRDEAAADAHAAAAAVRPPEAAPIVLADLDASSAPQLVEPDEPAASVDVEITAPPPEDDFGALLEEPLTLLDSREARSFDLPPASSPDAHDRPAPELPHAPAASDAPPPSAARLPYDDDVIPPADAIRDDDAVARQDTALDDGAVPHAGPVRDDDTVPQDTATGPILPLAEMTPAEPELRMPEPPRDPLAGIHDDVDEQVLSIFLEEASELYPQAGEQVRAWRRNPDDYTVAQQLRRTLHTFKGSARMAGAMRLGELTHRMESRLMDDDLPAAATPELLETLDGDLDQIAFVLDALRAGKTNVELPGFETVAPAEVPAETAGVVGGDEDDSARALEQDLQEAETAARAMLRVRADVVDRLVNEAGEVAIARARVEGELRSLKSNLLELTNSVIRLRTQVREIELQAETQIQSRMSAVQTVHQDFDPLELDRFTRFQELTRSLAEGVNDVSTVQQALLKNLDDADAALLAQARLSRDVQQRLFAIRTVPFGSLSERLYRILRSTARELDKRANLEIHGAQVELDRSMLEKLAGPLEHLLRNAVDHGLEPRDARSAAGKPETGEISLTAKQVGNEILIEIADDGAGIDFAAVAERARVLGMIPREARPTDQQLIECLFHPGFTTATKVTQISGRGIGMDVVRTEIAALGGRVEVHSTRGKGTEFKLFLPLTLAVAQAVMIRAGGRLWALPAPTVEQVQQVKGDVLRDLYARGSVDWQGRNYPLHYLPRLLGDTALVPEIGRTNPVLLLRSGQGFAAIHVDEMVGNQEVVVKNIGPQLARVSGISGATVLGTGEIVLIINPVQLATRPDAQVYDPTRHAAPAIAVPAPAPGRSGPPLVLVVDDSLTVRKITSRMLQREGFDVATAKDGMDALQVVAEQMPDIILLDIEMPRMDGFEFTKNLKNEPRHAGIPIIMITSRTAEKHRRHAAELGVDHYLGKPYQEEELLRHLRELLRLPTPV